MPKSALCNSDYEWDFRMQQAEEKAVTHLRAWQKTCPAFTDEMLQWELNRQRNCNFFIGEREGYVNDNDLQ
jgi:hypothetical protein